MTILRTVNSVSNELIKISFLEKILENRFIQTFSEKLLTLANYLSPEFVGTDINCKDKANLAMDS